MIGDFVLPRDVAYGSEFPQVESIKELDLSPVWGPSLAAIQKCGQNNSFVDAEFSAKRHVVGVPKALLKFSEG